MDVDAPSHLVTFDPFPIWDANLICPGCWLAVRHRGAIWHGHMENEVQRSYKN